MRSWQGGEREEGERGGDEGLGHDRGKKQGEDAWGTMDAAVGSGPCSMSRSSLFEAESQA